jgi:LPS-assembly lipoprotein
MSSSSLRRSLKVLPLVAAAWLLAGCTAGPLYGTTHIDPASGARANALVALKGRIAVTPAQTRTAQVFRNAMLYALNGAEPVREPLYELRPSVTASDQITSLEAGTGAPAASLYRMTVDYDLVRLSDGVSLSKGQRFAMVPYDRTQQLYAAERAVVDARDQAGKAVAERILAVVAPVIQRDATAAPVVTK